MKDVTYYRHQLIHKQNAVRDVELKTVRAADSMLTDLDNALTALTERHPPRLEIVEYMLRKVKEELEAHRETLYKSANNFND